MTTKKNKPRYLLVSEDCGVHSECAASTAYRNCGGSTCGGPTRREIDALPLRGVIRGGGGSAPEWSLTRIK